MHFYLLLLLLLLLPPSLLLSVSSKLATKPREAAVPAIERIEVDLLDLVEEAVDEAIEEVESLTKEVLSQDGAGQDFQTDLEVGV